MSENEPKPRAVVFQYGVGSWNPTKEQRESVFCCRCGTPLYSGESGRVVLFIGNGQTHALHIGCVDTQLSEEVEWVDADDIADVKIDKGPDA